MCPWTLRTEEGAWQGGKDDMGQRKWGALPLGCTCVHVCARAYLSKTVAIRIRAGYTGTAAYSVTRYGASSELGTVQHTAGEVILLSAEHRAVCFVLSWPALKWGGGKG